jgi:hypothetical protein
VCIDSLTLWATRTGRPAFRAKAATSGSILVYDLLPKPPPTNGMISRTLARGRWKIRASSVRTRKGCWADAHTVRASWSQRATTVWGSSA